MASFEIVNHEGQRFVRIRIEDETIRAESGALSHMLGDIHMTARLPSLMTAIKAAVSGQAAVRPAYTGTGEIFLEPSSGGYHVFEVTGESWVLENGAYWASEASVDLGLFRERAMTAFWAGEGFIDYQTLVSGCGKVVLNAPGPIQELAIDGQRVVVEGRRVIARTRGLDYRIRRPAGSIWGSWLSGESMVRVFEGTGKVLMAPYPYWNERLMQAVRG